MLIACFLINPEYLIPYSVPSTFGLLNLDVILFFLLSSPFAFLVLMILWVALKLFFFPPVFDWIHLHFLFFFYFKGSGNGFVFSCLIYICICKILKPFRLMLKLFCQLCKRYTLKKFAYNPNRVEAKNSTTVSV